MKNLEEKLKHYLVWIIYCRIYFTGFITYLFLSYSWRTIWQGIGLLILILLPLVILKTIKTIKLESREEKTSILKKLELKVGKEKK